MVKETRGLHTCVLEPVELVEIFHNVGREFFRALEMLASIADDM